LIKKKLTESAGCGFKMWDWITPASLRDQK
jgi:hypothetical protein